MNRAQLLVITKAPVAGRSKTRLTPPCTPEQAAAIAAAAVGDTLDAARRASPGRVVVALEGAAGGLDLSGCAVVGQRPGGLGARLAGAFADAMPGGCVPTLLVGMDTPQASPELLTRCLDRLREEGPGRAVLGRSTDGGWWALGLWCADPARALVDVPMSRDDTAEHTSRALVAAGLQIAELPELTDIDRFDDALAVASRCPPGSRTAQVVAEVAGRVERAA